MFEFTKEGCAAAVSYLLMTGQYDLLEKEQSTDEYTLVALANSLAKDDPLMTEEFLQGLTKSIREDNMNKHHTEPPYDNGSYHWGALDKGD